MRTFEQIFAIAAKRKGGPKALEKLLPKPKSRRSLLRVKDDRVLAQMTKNVFRAGFVWRVIEAKWPGFEEAFDGFDPEAMADLHKRDLDRLVKDERIVRNMQKILTVRDNAELVLEIEEHGSFARWLADWPNDDLIGLHDVLKKRGARLGGFTGQYFLREIGRDTFMLTPDVMKRLELEGVVDKAKTPTSKKARRACQEAFDEWHEQSGRPYAQISRVLSMSVE